MGSIALFLAYAGTNIMKVAVVGGTLLGLVLLRRRKVPPFGNLINERVQTHLLDPVLVPFRTLLEEQKRRYFTLVAVGWIAALVGVAVLGALDPPSGAAYFEGVWQAESPELKRWPWLHEPMRFVGGMVFVGLVALFGTFASGHVYALAMHVLAWRARAER